MVNIIIKEFTKYQKEVFLSLKSVKYICILNKNHINKTDRPNLMS